MSAAVVPSFPLGVPRFPRGRFETGTASGAGRRRLRLAGRRPWDVAGDPAGFVPVPAVLGPDARMTGP
ncbi:hypothetical protein [Actinoplanes teichomyceticus]|uniref:hypothetical protein n=1 Tax=Actinoplanes teichomyceticus TaxID=1867 RepID=UPI0011A91F72|nr:hypothetical protein [Actinoplanes teichomyceticus]